MPHHDRVPPATLARENFTAGGKVFYLELKENARGRYIQIIEDSGNRRDMVLLPVEGAAEFYRRLGKLLEFEATLAGQTGGSDE